MTDILLNLHLFANQLKFFSVQKAGIKKAQRIFTFSYIFRVPQKCKMGTYQCPLNIWYLFTCHSIYSQIKENKLEIYNFVQGEMVQVLGETYLIKFKFYKLLQRLDSQIKDNINISGYELTSIPEIYYIECCIIRTYNKFVTGIAGNWTKN